MSSSKTFKNYCYKTLEMNKLNEKKQEYIEIAKKLYIKAIKNNDIKTINDLNYNLMFNFEFDIDKKCHILCCEYDVIKEAVKHKWFMKDYYFYDSMYYLIETNKKKELILLVNEFDWQITEYILKNNKKLIDLIFMNKETLNHLLAMEERFDWVNFIVSKFKA